MSSPVSEDDFVFVSRRPSADLVIRPKNHSDQDFESCRQHDSAAGSDTEGFVLIHSCDYTPYRMPEASTHQDVAETIQHTTSHPALAIRTRSIGSPVSEPQPISTPLIQDRPCNSAVRARRNDRLRELMIDRIEQLPNDHPVKQVGMQLGAEWHRNTPSPAAKANEYQYQLMLLDMQNRKRLAMAHFPRLTTPPHRPCTVEDLSAWDVARYLAFTNTTTDLRRYPILNSFLTRQYLQNHHLNLILQEANNRVSRGPRNAYLFRRVTNSPLTVESIGLILNDISHDDHLPTGLPWGIDTIEKLRAWRMDLLRARQDIMVRFARIDGPPEAEFWTSEPLGIPQPRVKRESAHKIHHSMITTARSCSFEAPVELDPCQMTSKRVDDRKQTEPARINSPFTVPHVQKAQYDSVADYQMHSMLLEQEVKKRWCRKDPGSDRVTTLADYQLMDMLFEQANKKRKLQEAAEKLKMEENEDESTTSRKKTKQQFFESGKHELQESGSAAVIDRSCLTGNELPQFNNQSVPNEPTVPFDTFVSRTQASRTSVHPDSSQMQLELLAQKYKMLHIMQLRQASNGTHTVCIGSTGSTTPDLTAQANHSAVDTSHNAMDHRQKMSKLVEQRKYQRDQQLDTTNSLMSIPFLPPTQSSNQAPSHQVFLDPQDNQRGFMPGGAR